MSERHVGVVPGIEMDELVGRITDEFLERLDRGEQPQVEDYARRYPEAAAVIRRVFPALEWMRRPAKDADAAPPGEAADGDAAVECMGDFRILREIGRGGMGIVYEAQQLSLRRRVALKVLPFAAAMDAKQLARFELEAQAAACLHHTNIVPVHAVGSERGVPFYAMEYIEGCSLAQLIGELRRLEGQGPPEDPVAILAHVSTSALAAALVSGIPVGQTGRFGGLEATTAAEDQESSAPEHETPACPSKEPAVAPEPCSQGAPTSGSSVRGREYICAAARFGIQVAEALDHAHTRGIIHRDIKPGNLLIDTHGQLWVTDFGLAQIQGSPGLTLTGDVLGTLRYMSPEQVLAKRVVIDGRTDIYSLGVTLFEMLTLRPAIDGQDRMEILRRIAEQEPRPLRQLNPAIPRDLETILLKAMAKEPAGRYTTARDLADELRRFLEHKPICARRPSLLDRATKWARRHRPLVASSAVATVLFLTLAVVVLASSNLRIQREQHRADEEKQRAEANLRRARDVVDRMFTRVAQDLAHTPRMEKVRRALLVDALEFYQEFLKENGTNPTLRYETACAHIKVGDIQHILGQYGHAEGAWRQAIFLLEKLSAQFPAVAEYRENLAYCFGALGLGLGNRSRHEEAIKERLHELDLREKMTTDFPNIPDFRRKLALAHTDMGNSLTPAERVQEAERHFRQALIHWEKLRADFPEVPEDRAGLAHIHHWWGDLLLKTNRLAEAEQEFRKVLAIREQLLADQPGNDDLKSLLAHIQDYLGLVLIQRSRLELEGGALHRRFVEEAETQFRRSIHRYEMLMEDFPDTPEFRRRLAHVYDHLSGALLRMGRVPEAIDAIRRSISEKEKLIPDSSHGRDSRHGIGEGWGYYQLGLLLQSTGRVQEAADAFRQAKNQFEKKAADNPRVPGVLRELAHFLTTCPATQFRDVHRAITLARQALQLAPLWPESWYTLALAAYRAEQWDAAIEAWEKWTKLGPTSDNPEAGFYLAIAHGRLGHKKDARKWYDQAVGWMDRRKPRDEDLRRLKAEAAELLGLTEPAASAKKEVPRSAKG